jgi:HK97 family phage prohead protease
MDDVVTLFTRAATIGAQSWNEEARTLDVVFATSNPVERQDYKGTYLERLDMQQDWTPFIGAPVLDSHKRGALGDVLGSVIAAKTLGNEGRATIQISKRRKASAIVDDIKAGHIRGVSVGYRVMEWKDSTEGGKRVRTATKWSPAELSIVAVGADPGATIRSKQMETNTDPPIENRAAINVGFAESRRLPASRKHGPIRRLTPARRSRPPAPPPSRPCRHAAPPPMASARPRPAYRAMTPTISGASAR